MPFWAIERVYCALLYPGKSFPAPPGVWLALHRAYGWLKRSRYTYYHQLFDSRITYFWLLTPVIRQCAA